LRLNLRLSAGKFVKNSTRLAPEMAFSVTCTFIWGPAFNGEIITLNGTGAKYSKGLYTNYPALILLFTGFMKLLENHTFPL